MKVNNSKKNIANIVKEWVRRSEYTQSQLADLLGVSQPVLSLQLNGVKPIPVERIKEIAVELRPPPEDLDAIRALLSEKLDFLSKEDINEYAERKSKWDNKLLHALEIASEKRLFLSKLLTWLNVDPNGVRIKKIIDFMGDDLKNIPPYNVGLDSLANLIHCHPLLSHIDGERLYNYAKRLEQIQIKWEEFEANNSTTIKAILEKIKGLSEPDQEKILSMILDMKKSYSEKL